MIIQITIESCLLLFILLYSLFQNLKSFSMGHICHGLVQSTKHCMLHIYSSSLAWMIYPCQYGLIQGNMVCTVQYHSLFNALQKIAFIYGWMIEFSITWHFKPCFFNILHLMQNRNMNEYDNLKSNSQSNLTDSLNCSNCAHS